MLRPLRLLQCQLTRPPSVLWSTDPEGGGLVWRSSAWPHVWLFALSESTRSRQLVLFGSEGSGQSGDPIPPWPRSCFEGSHTVEPKRAHGLDPARMIGERKGLCQSRLRFVVAATRGVFALLKVSAERHRW